MFETFSTRYLTANSTLRLHKPPDLAAVGDGLPVSACQALAEHAAPNAGIRAPTAGRLRSAFWTSPLVHWSRRFGASGSCCWFSELIGWSTERNRSNM